MTITKQVVDKLNIIIKVDISKEDYGVKVENILNDYAKKASISGFRKGHVPLGMIRKKYGKAVKLEEVNKILQESLKTYLSKEKIASLGYPIPTDDKVDLEHNNLSFKFELGLKPEVKVNLKTRKSVRQYEVIIDDSFIDSRVKDMRKRFGKITSKDTITDKTDEVTGAFSLKEDESEARDFTFEISDLKSRTTSLLKGKEVGDSVEIKAQNFFEKQEHLALALHLEKKNKIKGKLSFTIKEINHRELSEVNQDFFDKVYGTDIVKSKEDMREKIKQTFGEKFKIESDQYLLNDFTKRLLEDTKFDLPEVFLKKWLQKSSEEKLTEEEAKAELEKSIKGLRYQLIEGQILLEYDIEPSVDELKNFTKTYIIDQMQQFGRTDAKDEEITDITNRILTNEDEAKKLYNQLLSQKLLELYKTQGNIKLKKVSFDDFIKKVYQTK